MAKPPIASWQTLSKFPGGKKLFSLLLGWTVPYSGSISPEITELSPGHAEVLARDRRRLRNHLGSIHAAALMNLAELASGLAFVASLPAGVKGIVSRFEIEYLKKARGTLRARCDCEAPKDFNDATYLVSVEIFNEAKETVARATATWRVRK